MDPVQFLLKVWGWNAQPGQYVFLATKKGDRWKDHGFLYGKELKDELRSFLNRDHQNVYFCPNAFSRNRRHLDYAVGGRLFWSDLDDVDPEACAPRPTVAIRSSPGRFVGLWHLPSRLEHKILCERNRDLTYSIGADKGGWDYTQVLRLPGTRNFKYEGKPRVRLLWFEDKPIALPKVASDIYDKYRSKMSARLKTAVKAKTVIVGQRSSMLWWMENELVKIGMKPQEIITLLKDTPWNKYKGRRDENERFRAEVMKIVSSQGDVDDDEPEKPERVQKYSDAIVRLVDVEPEPVHWVWYPYIPKGKLTIIEGDPSMGKSWITFALAAHISNRKRLPNQDKPVSGRVLLMSAEDGLADTVRPRLNSLNANVRKVYAYARPLTLDEEGIEELETQIVELRPLAIIIDPLVAYMGGTVDLHKANQTREFTARLADLAERYGCAIIGLRHLTKSGRDKAIYRGIGSIDLTAAARSVLHVGQDPEDETSRVIVHIKSNLAPLGPSIRYVLRANSSSPFKWMGTTRLRAVDLVNADKDVKRTEDEVKRCVMFLKDRLKRPAMHEDILRDAEAKGISRAVLKQARDQLGIEAERVNGKWQWRIIHD